MGAPSLQKRPVPASQEDCSCSSVSTASTHELTPLPLHDRPRRQSLMMMIERVPSAQKIQLLLPHLDHDVVMEEPSKINIWTSTFMTTLYAIAAVALVFRNVLILYAIPFIFFFETIRVIMKWKIFVAEDPQVLKARSYLGSHMKQVRKELTKSKDGGYLRRRQEALVAGMSGTSLAYAHEFFERQATAIRLRISEEHKRSVSLYGNTSSGGAEQ